MRESDDTWRHVILAFGGLIARTEGESDIGLIGKRLKAFVPLAYITSTIAMAGLSARDGSGD